MRQIADPEPMRYRSRSNPLEVRRVPDIVIRVAVVAASSLVIAWLLWAASFPANDTLGTYSGKGRIDALHPPNPPPIDPRSVDLPARPEREPPLSPVAVPRGGTLQ